MIRFYVLMMTIVILFGGVIGQDDDEDFIVRPILYKAVTDLREVSIFQLEVVNKGNGQYITVGSDSDFVEIDKSKIYLENRESQTFSIRLGKGLHSKGVYATELLVKSESSEKRVPVILEYESPSPIYDAVIDVHDENNLITSGGKLNFEVRVYKIKGVSSGARILIKLKDFSGKEYFSELESLSLEKEAKLTKSIDVPKELFGNYIIVVEVEDVNSYGKGTASHLLSIVDEIPQLSPEPIVLEDSNYNLYVIIALVALLVLILAFIVFNHLWNRKLKRQARNWRKEIVNVKRVRVGEIPRKIKKLEYQLSILRKAFNKGYVKRISYLEGRKKLSAQIKTLKKRL
jgi:hypothetical protein